MPINRKSPARNIGRYCPSPPWPIPCPPRAASHPSAYLSCKTTDNPPAIAHKLRGGPDTNKKRARLRIERELHFSKLCFVLDRQCTLLRGGGCASACYARAPPRRQGKRRIYTFWRALLNPPSTTKSAPKT